MAATAQSNATLADIAQALRAHDDYLIVGHVSPDGDCLGSQLALMHALRQLGKQVCCVLATDATSIDTSLTFLPSIETMLAADQVVVRTESEIEAQHKSAPCVIALDVPTYDRMGSAAASLHEKAPFTVTVDHHENKKALSTLNHVDPQAASTTLLVWQLIEELGIQPNSDMALCALTGLITDTGRFQYQNTSPFALRCAANMLEAGANLELICTQIFQRKSRAALALEQCALERLEFLLDGSLAISYVTLDDFAKVGATKTDADDIINTLRSIDGVRVACMLRETEDKVRGSLRSKDATDVSRFAAKHNGGGHKAAAGMTLQGNMQDIFARAKTELCAYLQEAWKA